MENDIDKHARKWVAVLHEQAKQNPQVDWELWARWASQLNRLSLDYRLMALFADIFRSTSLQR